MAFGSYGWAPNGPNDVNGYLEQMDFELLRQPLTCKWRPTAEVLDECRQAGAMLAEKALQAEATGQSWQP